jgi:chromosome segregation ATPase
MNVLQKLQDKINELKKEHESIKMQNEDLKNKLAGVASKQEEQQNLINHLKNEAEKCSALESTIDDLRLELLEKDEEIEKIISQVEALLSE